LKLDGTRVREARERLALSIEDVSAKARVSPHTWIRAEHGDEIRPSSVRSIAEYLGVVPGELMESSPVPKAEAPSPSQEADGASENPLDIAYKATVEQARQDAQAVARAAESGQPQISHVSAENEAAVELDQKFRSYDLAVALVDRTRQYVELEQDNAVLKARLNELQNLERALEQDPT
jgi:transcriptional regulator with XRE-family HTH domain